MSTIGRPVPPQFQLRRSPRRSLQIKIAGLAAVVAVAFGYGAYAILGANALTPSNDSNNSARISNGSAFLQKLCNNSVKATTTGTLKDNKLTRVSGIVASRAKAGYYWVHNDAGDSARIYSIKRDGSLVGTFNLPEVNAKDWEDIDMGPGPVSGRNYLYIADTGDNKLNRTSVTIYRVAEPNPDIDGGTISFNKGSVDTLSLTYPDGAHDVEAVFIDQRTGDIYAIDKAANRPANIYRAPGGLANGSNTLFSKVSSVALKSGDTYQKITAADMSPDNSMIAVRSYERVVVFAHKGSDDVAKSFVAANGCLTPAYNEAHGEAIAFRSNNAGLVSTSEGKAQPLFGIDPR